MKKIGLFVALALIVTVGGTYATWNYTKADKDAVPDVTESVGITLEAAQETTVSSGTITIKKSEDFAINIDDDGNHNATLSFKGTLTVSFSGSGTAGNETVKGLNLVCTASGDQIQYKGNDVFKYTPLNANREVGNGTDQSQPFAQWVIGADELAKMIQLNGTVTASTIDEYNQLKTALDGKTITITVGAVVSGT